MAWNIGANDVANAMGTSVGSGAIGLKQAILIAAILEFSGAFFFGSHVSETIQSGILNPDYFSGNPRILALGMLSALIGTGIWLQIASYFGWPVSATHTIVGSLIGFGLLIDGSQSIYWKEVYSIIVSWLLSPLLGGLLSFSLFTYLRRRIFYQPHPLEEAKKIVPQIAFFVITVLSLILFFQGSNDQSAERSFFLGISLSLALGTASFFIATWLVKKHIPLICPLKAANNSTPQITGHLERVRMALEQAKALSAGEINYQIATLLEEVDSTSQTIQNPEEYAQTSHEFSLIEKMFGYLQVISACLMAFSHGANDVANAIGPVSAAIAILQTGVIAINATIPSWTLALGGLGIVMGLATWGWRVIETVGKKITELTPTRGFAAEFGAAFTVLLASRLGLPISTTHTLIGAVIGVGLARGIEALNLGMMREIATSWIVTVPAGAISAGVIFTLLATIFGTT